MFSSFTRRYEYVPIDKDESICSDSQEKRKSWRQKQVPLVHVLVIVVVQTVLWITSLALFHVLHMRHVQGAHPLDNYHRMFEDNSYPAAEVISYETVIFAEDKSYMSSTNGSLPSAETDALWQALQDPVDGVIQAAVHTGFDIQHLPESNISNVDSRYHSYGLEVFHQLHCLDRIRKTFHAEHYFPNDTEAELIWHREHCIDHLRQGIMCSGDIAMDRWQYDIETDQNWLKTDVPHVCRNFESLSNWVKKWRFRNRDWLHFKDTGKLDQAAS